MSSTNVRDILRFGKILGQLRPADTNAASLYSPASGVAGLIRRIIVTNTTGGAVTYRIFVDDDGTTYDQTTAIRYDDALAANVTDSISVDIPLGSSGNLAVRSSSANAITFTAIGIEEGL